VKVDWRKGGRYWATGFQPGAWERKKAEKRKGLERREAGPGCAFRSLELLGFWARPI